MLHLIQAQAQRTLCCFDNTRQNKSVSFGYDGIFELSFIVLQKSVRWQLSQTKHLVPNFGGKENCMGVTGECTDERKQLFFGANSTQLN
jgi:hypothetical protein